VWCHDTRFIELLPADLVIVKSPVVSLAALLSDAHVLRRVRLFPDRLAGTR